MSGSSALNRITRRVVLALAGAGMATSPSMSTASPAGRTDCRHVLKDLYDSEINFSIVTLWHGMDVALGDYVNGVLAETHVRELTEAEDWLKREAIRHFPDSVFALIYRDGLTRDEAEARQRALVAEVPNAA
jgi:hypothetical protein